VENGLENAKKLGVEGVWGKIVKMKTDIDRKEAGRKQVMGG
jgi:hypothetical protein